MFLLCQVFATAAAPPMCDKIAAISWPRGFQTLDFAQHQITPSHMVELLMGREQIISVSLISVICLQCAASPVAGLESGAESTSTSATWSSDTQKSLQCIQFSVLQFHLLALLVTSLQLFSSVLTLLKLKRKPFQASQYWRFGSLRNGNPEDAFENNLSSILKEE